MAVLGANSAFFNESQFGFNSTVTLADGVSGTRTSDGSTTAKVLYNVSDKHDGFTTVIQSVSAKINDITYELDILGSYHNKVIAVVNDNRESTQFTFNSGASLLITTAAKKRHAGNPLSATALATVSAQGFNSVGPTLRRLYNLGYV